MSATPGYRALVWDDERAQRYWRWQANFPEQYFTRQFGDRIARALAPLLAGKRELLDYGSGVGYLVAPLAAQGFAVTATDHSEAAVAATTERNAGVAGFEGATTPDRLLGAGRRFDAIISIEVIEHLSEDHLAGYFDAFRRLLKPDGLAIITTPNDEDLRASETYCPCCDQVFHRWQHLRSFSAASLAATVAANGLRVGRTLTTDFARLPAWRDPLGSAKRLAKRALGRVVKEPHLVCIVELTG
jgi:2-polyprenyl-3-methyl-5-hydroxy-6-metoxy-1,4-benzoquinol methylase